MNAAVLFSHWDTVREGLYEALDQLTDDQLAFVPREGLWSLGTVALHIATAEEGWFRYVVTGELDEWPEVNESDYPTVSSIKALLREVHDQTMAYLEALDVADLDRVVDTFWGARLTLRWIIWHVLEHEISHRGEIYLMLGLMGMEAPDV
ncbi:MAG: DinB family protein [Anaerolineae bacterium]|jgi:uncharacterized damage-inducible protein DinB